MKLGRRPFCTSPYSVNWDTTSTAPCTSASARFILPSASPNTRRPSSLSAIQASVSPVSEGANPARTRNPTPILPVTLPATRTSARETRCRTTLTAPFASLYRHALREISRLVYVAAAAHRDVVLEQLERQHREHGRQEIERLRHLDFVVSGPRDAGVALGDDRHHAPAARLHFLDVAHDLLVHRVLGRDEHDRHQVIDQRDRAVLHLGCGIDRKSTRLNSSHTATSRM